MIAKAQLKFIRGSARKIRQVVDLIRGLDVAQANSILPNVNKRPALMIQKLLKSAVSNAKVKGVEEEDLYISRVFADEAARWKRYKAAAFGRATEILKRTSHVTIELELKADAKIKAKTKAKTKAKAKPKPKNKEKPKKLIKSKKE